MTEGIGQIPLWCESSQVSPKLLECHSLYVTHISSLVQFSLMTYRSSNCILLSFLFSHFKFLSDFCHINRYFPSPLKQPNCFSQHWCSLPYFHSFLLNANSVKFNSLLIFPVSHNPPTRSKLSPYLLNWIPRQKGGDQRF